MTDENMKMTFEDLKKKSLNDIFDRKRISLEERYELNGFINKIETVEHLQSFLKGLESMFVDKPHHLRSSNANKSSKNFEENMKEYLRSTESDDVN